jgi:hypothetical protein
MKTYKSLILFALIIAGVFNLFTKFDDVTAVSFYLLIVGECWVLYNFYACLFDKELLVPPDLDDLITNGRKYLRYLVVGITNGGLYTYLFFV